MNAAGKNNKHDFAIWLRLAQDDLASAKALLEEKIYSQVCFHSQQAAEKMLKAFLKSQGATPPKIHNLLELLQMCMEKDDDFIALEPGCEYLSRFYIVTRYPEALPGSLAQGLPDLKEAKKALECAKEIVAFTTKKLCVKT
jgi:HEPN domain-containing protein